MCRRCDAAGAENWPETNPLPSLHNQHTIGLIFWRKIRHLVGRQEACRHVRGGERANRVGHEYRVSPVSIAQV